MQNKQVTFGPIAITNAVTNLFNPGTTTGGVNMPGNSGNLFFIIKHLRIVNKAAAPHNFSLYKGATGASAAGTEVVGNAKNVPANDAVDWYGAMRLDAADFLTGVADANSVLTIEGEGEIGVN